MGDVVKNSNFNAKPVMFGGINNIFDERGSSFLAIRKVQWVKEGSEPDESKAKLEIRKWMVQDGQEVAFKGCAFLTDEGPHNLTKALIQEGYGHTGELLGELKKREDFKDAVNHLNDDEDFGEGEYFDMRSILLTAADESNSEDEDDMEIDDAV